MSADRKSPRELARETREAIKDPEMRAQFADDTGRLSDAVSGLLRSVNSGIRAPKPEVASDSSCGGWYAAEDLCLQMAIRTGDDSWADLADSYGTMGAACEALEHTL